MSIISTIVQFTRDIPPWAMVEPDQAGVWIRGGKLKRRVNPGFYIKWPIYDKIRVVEVVEQIIRTPSRSFQTRDGITLTLRLAIIYEVEDVVAAILSVQDYDDVMPEMAMDAAAAYISNSNLDDCGYNELSSEITDALQTDACRWGLEIQPIWIVELCKSRVFRVISDDGKMIKV